MIWNAVLAQDQSLNTTDDEVESELSGEIAEENDATSLLRLHNTDWMLTEGIQVDQFQGSFDMKIMGSKLYQILINTARV